MNNPWKDALMAPVTREEMRAASYSERTAFVDIIQDLLNSRVKAAEEAENELAWAGAGGEDAKCLPAAPPWATGTKGSGFNDASAVAEPALATQETDLERRLFAMEVKIVAADKRAEVLADACRELVSETFGDETSRISRRGSAISAMRDEQLQKLYAAFPPAARR